MKIRLSTSLIALVFSAFTAGSGSAQELVAGWDFSQYAGDGFMSVDGGSSFTNVLSANYSDLDPTFGAGFESAAFGTMYADGQFGSTSVDPTSATAEFLPSAAVGGSLVSNLDAPAVGFDAFSVLSSEGQVSAESLAMIANSGATIVFEADLSGAGRTGSDWSLSFGARAFSGTSAIAIEFSSDGDTFESVGTANLTSVDSKFTAALAAESSEKAYVRFSFSPSGNDLPFIDNVAISAVLSEPPTTTTTSTTSTTTTTTTTSSSTTTVPTTTTTVPTTTTTTSTTAPTTTSTSSTVPTATTSTTTSTVPTTTTTSTSTTAPTTTTTSTTTTVPTTTSTTSTTAPTTSTTTTVPTTTTTSTTAPTTTSTTNTTAPSTTTTTSTTSTTSSTTTTLPDDGRISVCHKGKRTIRVSTRAVFAHLFHGDRLGECPEDPSAD